MLVSGRVSQFSGVCHLHSCGPYSQSLVASSEETPVWDPCPPGYIWTNSPRPFWTSKTWRYVFYSHMYIYIYRIMWAHFNTYLDYMPISCRCYFGKDQLKANGLVYHSNVKAKNNQTLVTLLFLIHSRNPRAGHFCHTPLKINMEPKNHPIEKENHLPNLHFGFHVNFPGCRCVNIRKFVGHPK